MDTIVILDFGSQVTQLIARRLRAMRYHAEIVPFSADVSQIDKPEIIGIIFSGGPASVYAKGAPHVDKRIFDLGKPILGICYGLQEIAFQLGGSVVRGERREYGRAEIACGGSLFDNTPKKQTVWMSHGDKVVKIPKGFRVLASSVNSPYAAVADPKRNLYGVQFHLEVSHTAYGSKILENFARICGMRRQWTPKVFVDHAISLFSPIVGNREVINGVSGGVDSTVLALLLKKSGVRVKNIFIDNGLLRLNEAKQVQTTFKKLKLPLTFIDASEHFLRELAGVTDPEQKRKIIGRVFIEEFMRHIGPRDFLSQGTLYPDVIESVSVHGPSDTIKTHHNRAPEVLDLIKQNRVVEPLKELFKDEVREVGKQLGLPQDSIWRHPFPGPGLGIRILGEITPERLEILRQADAIFIEEIKKQKHYGNISQALAALDTSRAVGVKGDEREYGYMIVLRAVTTDDFMTADWYQFPHDFLSHVSTRIINEVTGVTRVLYDISQKPPATIEFL